MFLYFPAVLAMIGFQLQTAYKAYMLGVNIATCLVAYFCFGKMFKSDKIGLLASLVYKLAPYRLSNLYIRAAVGEYTAMISFPLIFYGLFSIYREEEKCQKGCIAAIVGYTGLIQTHIISCEIIGFLTIIFCALLWKKTMYIPIPVNRVHEVLGPLSREMRTTFTKGVPLRDYR